MSKAFKCDICDCFYDGNAMIQIKTNVIGIKYSPENPEAPIYLHDACDDCHAQFIKTYRELRDNQQKKARFKNAAN